MADTASTPITDLFDISTEPPPGAPQEPQASQVPQDSAERIAAERQKVKDATPPVEDLYDIVGTDGTEGTGGEAAMAAARGVVTGAVENAPVVAGVVTGARIGGAIGTAGGPYAFLTVPLGALAGAAVGGAAGYFAGQAARDALTTVHIPWTGETFTYDSLQEVPEWQRPYAAAGESFGGSATWVAAPYLAGMAKVSFGTGLVGRWFNGMVDTAFSAPKSFLVAEVSSAFGAAAGAGIAEQTWPGQLGPRIGAEFVGGFSSPTRWAAIGVRAGINTYRKVGSVVSEAARENRAAEIIQRIVTESGENPTLVAERIAEELKKYPDLEMTSGQLAASDALIGLEAGLVKESDKFGAKIRKQTENNLVALREMIRTLESTGDPTALTKAAELRLGYYETLVKSYVDMASTRALEAASLIDPTNSKSVATFGAEVDNILDESITSLRTTERSLWEQVPRDVAVEPGDVLETYAELLTRRLPEEVFPEPAAGFIARIQNEGVATTGEFIRFRSRALELARESAAKGNWGDANIYGSLAEAALADLSKIDDAALTSARDFSRTFNDTFTRTFAGETQRRAPTGADRMPPEVIMKRAFGGGGEMNDLKFKQLQQAATMASAEHATRMLDMQERTIRYMAAETIGENGRVNEKALYGFMKKNADLLDRFPEIRDQLTDARTAEKLLKAREVRAAKLARDIENRTVFAKIVKNDDPSQVIERTLSTKNRRDFAALVKLADEGGEKARTGFARLLYDHVYQKAVMRDGGFSFQAYQRAWEEPITADGMNLADLMMQHGFMSPAVRDKLREFTARGAFVEQTLSSRQGVSAVVADADMMTDAVVRMAGASAASHLSFAGAHPLIVGYTGSRVARQIFEKVPRGKIKDVIMEASQDPELMKLLLAKPKTKADRLKLGRQLNAFLYQMAVTAQPYEEPKSTSEQRIDELYETVR